MPFISEAASAIKSRFGFHDRNSEHNSIPSIRSTPDLQKTASKQHLLHSSAIPNIASEREDQSFEVYEDPSFWKDHNVQVIIRLRPLSSSEISLQGSSKCVRQDSNQTVTWTGHPESRFTFDIVADESVSQEMLFKVAGVPMVENCISGYNSCMFAYGQTGSGKTHTMLGDIEGGTRRHSVNCGMTPRVFEYLFSRIQKEREARREEKIRYTCKCSFLEIYNEQILDLLDPSSINLQIREDTKKGVYVDNLTEVEVSSSRDVLQQLVQGSANRKVASTNMNRASSRSHSVFTCIIESKWESQGVTHHRFARLNLVDLAGSERQKSSGAEGERLKEATNINKSLSTLGLVIMNLVSISNGKSLHVPYRDSKLTFLLQDSLGGNSKTTIIANISPSSCCSLETLSTLKFAQRAKFIKNHATVNEDASGDVLAMRMQIQQLKKEVSRLQNVVNGGAENHESDAWSVSFPGSPGSFKWEGLNGSFSPFKVDKRVSQKREYEVALVGAFKREKDKDMALQALTASNVAAMDLAKQREKEVQGLKMRLRFRESGIKRLEDLASGKISAETHLLKEKEEYLQEIEVLRSQVDKNQDVTKFAMENLRLKEDIRRLKLISEEGEWERMNEQITILQNKLLEALDWKLMHESDPSTTQRNISEMVNDASNDCNLLASTKDPTSPWKSGVNEENEFLRMQAIQNQSEMDTLRKKLDSCIGERDKLERRLNDLVKEVEEERLLQVAMKEEKQKSQLEFPLLASDQLTSVASNDQTELKTMVDAIASASQREAKAQEIAVALSKENDELRMKLKILIEDNNKLIEIYEHAVAENINKPKAPAPEEEKSDNHSSHLTGFAEEKVLQSKQELEDLEHQLAEMHEENEKLLGLYEKAMQERDELKRMLYSATLAPVNQREDISCLEKLVVDKYSGSPRTNDYLDIDEIPNFVDARSVIECDFMDHDIQETVPLAELEASDKDKLCTGLPQLNESSDDTRIKVSKDLYSDLDKVQDMLSTSTNTISVFGSLERALLEIGELSRNIEALDDSILVKQQEHRSLNILSSEILEKGSLIEKKLLALKYSVSNFSSSLGYFEEREGRARTNLSKLLSYINLQTEELAQLEVNRHDIEEAKKKIQQSKVELKSNIAELNSKFEEENRRLECEKVLIAIDDNKPEVHQLQKTWKSSKATDLLKAEEEKTKLQLETKQAHQKLGLLRQEYEDLSRKFEKVDYQTQVIRKEIHERLKMVKEAEQKLQSIIEEKEVIMHTKEEGMTEVESLIFEYNQYLFEYQLKGEEIQIVDEELQIDLKRLEELHTARSTVIKMNAQLLAEMCDSGSLSDSIGKELQNVKVFIRELKSLFGDDSSFN
ncbi:kinesin-like protein KIN-12E [Heracleum sosnowskyi]|uniref:Kinesin-like protein KIN-12E n=1 Tax=Heracleum sosnowskyi TaxID=360622 RepID=A0AAD8MY84_9APIA|nr:kinesin-like protein KIN-12E [Heracleum sosnowskyi]